MKHKFILIFYLILAVSGFIPQVSAQDIEPLAVHPITGKLALTLVGIDHGSEPWPDSLWKYHLGDNPVWADPAYDDTDWESANTLLSQNALPESGWEGIGWFRLHFTVSDELIKNMPMALYVAYQAGASEIYLDGKLLYSFGKVGTRKEEEEPYWERNPQVISFSGETDHVIAVRYSNFSSYQSIPLQGFRLTVRRLNESITSRIGMVRQGTTFQMVWTAIPVFLMLQHLLLFFFYPRARENLYFALLTGSFGAFFFLFLQCVFVSYPISATQLLFLIRLLIGVYVLIFLSIMLFLYTLFYSKLPKIFWFFLTGWIITLFIGLSGIENISYRFYPSTFTYPFGVNADSIISRLSWLTILTLLEMARVIIVAIFKRKDGAWIFGLGSLSPIILIFIFNLILSRIDYNIIWIIWELGRLIILLAPLFSMSVFLARNVSRTRQKLETEELERQLLEVENTRKTEELEEARELQMSMLPDAPPELPNLNVAFEMRPATEVGGDYYDYNLTDDGKLTIAIGDATGHGMNAGLVVSAVKSLFKTTRPGTGNVESLERISQGVRSMNLKRLYMAMALATFEENKMTLTGAGMPPVLIYHADKNKVEEALLEGMPLGGGIGSEREEVSFDLQPGDTVLLMSDGLPEMMNPENQMLDYPKTKELFSEVADGSPKAIIEHLFKASTKWARGRPSEDDVTLVVIKVKQPENDLAQQNIDE